ncbi:MAG: hypothetical protein NT126_07210 [Bacteroidetes bacterium]|nr:hypothetical protein [Bacteroidota bacterium]
MKHIQVIRIHPFIRCFLFASRWKKKCIMPAVYVFLLFPGTIFSQTPVYNWAKTLPGNVESIQRDLVVDANRNVFITGVFFGTVDFDPGPGVANITPVPYGSNAYIAKYDSAGNYLWAKNIPINASYGNNSIGIDVSGNIYITGFFSGTVDFDPGSGVANLVSVSGSNDIYFAKYSSNGNYIWAKSIGSTGYDSGSEIKTDVFGNVYLAGNFSATVDFDPGAGVASPTSFGSTDIFFAKYDSNGNYLWVKQVGGTASEDLRDFTTDASGNIFITGSFNTTADFDPGAGVSNLVSTGGSDIFIAKYDQNGNYLWSNAFGSTGTDAGSAIKTDAAGSVFVTGIFTGTVDFDPGASVANQVGGGSYFGKYDAAGNYIWAKRLPLNTNNIDLALDAFGDVFISGSFLSGAPAAIDMDPGAGTANLNVPSGLPPPYYNIFAKYDGSGNYSWAGVFGHSCYCTVSGYKSALTIDANNTIYYSGIFNGSAFGSSTVDFDPGAGMANLTAPSSVDNVFFAKYGIQSSPFPVKLLSFTGENVNEINHLNWATASEINNDYFDVERRTDSDDFKKIGAVAGHGNSTQLIRYSFDDLQPKAGVNYYRLKQVDYNGDFEYSETIALKNHSSSSWCSELYTVENGLFRAGCSGSSNSILEILDVHGRKMFSEKISPENEDHFVEFDLRSFAAGMYLVTIADDEHVFHAKVIVQ